MGREPRGGGDEWTCGLPPASPRQVIQEHYGFLVTEQYARDFIAFVKVMTGEEKLG